MGASFYMVQAVHFGAKRKHCTIKMWSNCYLEYGGLEPVNDKFGLVKD